MSLNAVASAYKLSFQISPIILVGGVAQLIPGGMLPIIAITEALNFTIGLLSGGDDISLDSFFANFQPLSGGTLIDNQYGEYPFANQAVAANAAITQPLQVSLRMVCPARPPGGFAAKLATLTALRATIAQHVNSGGTFTVATPSYIYTNCVLLGLRDVTSGKPDQPQSVWQWDFRRPLLTEEQADFAMNSAMDRYSRGVPWSGAISGAGISVGSPLSLAAPSVIPSASNLTGSNVASSIFSG
jgi:hypothetical protein